MSGSTGPSNFTIECFEWCSVAYEGGTTTCLSGSWRRTRSLNHINKKIKIHFKVSREKYFFFFCLRKKCFFAKLTQNSKSNLKLTYVFFWIFRLPYSPHKFILFTKMPLVFFFLFENDIFTLSTSSSSNIYKISITINTSTTMNTQFEALNAPQIDLNSLFLNSYELKTTPLSLSLYIHPKKIQNFDSKIFMVHRAIEAYDSWWITFV